MNCLKDTKKHCKSETVVKLAFPKYGNGLDKLCGKDVENAIEKTFLDTIECTIYKNTMAPKEIDDLDINHKMQKLQSQDAQIKKMIEEIKSRKKLQGFVIQDGILMKLRKNRNKKIFKQLVVPLAIHEDFLKLCHDNYTGAHLGEKKT